MRVPHPGWVLVASLVAGTAFGADTMRFWNLTGETVTELYLAPTGTENFGPNQCLNDNDHEVDNDERLRLRDVSAGRYDVRLRLKSGRMCTVRNVALRDQGKYAFSIETKDLKECR